MLSKIPLFWSLTLVPLGVFWGMVSTGTHRNALLQTFSVDQNVWLKKGPHLIAKGGRNWSYALFTQSVPENAAIEAKVRILKPTKRRGIGDALNWFPYSMQRDDPGYDACLMLRHFGSSPTENWWYRIQVSVAYQEVVLHKGNGGYVKVAPAKIPLGKAFLIRAEARASRIRVWLEGHLVIDYEDEVAPILGQGGKWGVGNYESRICFDEIKILPHFGGDPFVLPPRKYIMSYRIWHEGLWVFSDDEPIAQFVLNESQMAEMKLLPGYQPQLHASLAWLEENQVSSLVSDLRLIEVEKDGKQLSFMVRGQTRYPRMSIENIIRIGFDADYGSYFYEFKGLAQLNDTDPNLPKLGIVKYNLLFPYNSSPNAWKTQIYDSKNPLVLKVPLLPQKIIRSDDFPYYHWELFYGIDGLLYRTPIRNDWDVDVPPSYKTRPYFYRTNFRPDTRSGTFIARALHPVFNPAITFYHDVETAKPSAAICSFSHETYLGWDASNERNFHAHYRYHGIAPSRMTKLFLSARLHSNPQPPRTKILHKIGVNRFGVEQQNTTSDPLVTLSWVGAYDVDQSMGFDDTHALILRDGGWTEFQPVSKGNSTYQLAPRYFLKFRLKGENSKGGQFFIGFFRDDHRETKTVSPIPENEWKLVRISTKLFAKKGKGRVLLRYEGGGKIWVDNLKLAPGETTAPFSDLFYSYFRGFAGEVLGSALHMP